jgi:hypothetical protein
VAAPRLAKSLQYEHKGIRSKAENFFDKINIIFTTHITIASNINLVKAIYNEV